MGFAPGRASALVVSADADEHESRCCSRIGEVGLELKGLRRPVTAFNVVQSTSPAEDRPDLSVVARGPAA
jgi:hypothetical protein